MTTPPRPKNIKCSTVQEAIARSARFAQLPQDTGAPLAPESIPSFTSELLVILSCAGDLMTDIRSSGWTLERAPDSASDVKQIVTLADAAHNFSMLAKSIERLNATGVGVRATMHNAKHLLRTIGSLQIRAKRGEVDLSRLNLTPCIAALTSIHDRLEALA